MIQTYSKHNTGREFVSKDIEEEQYQDILTLLQLLTNTLSKDFIDFGEKGLYTTVPGAYPIANTYLLKNRWWSKILGSSKNIWYAVVDLEPLQTITKIIQLLSWKVQWFFLIKYVSF